MLLNRTVYLAQISLVAVGGSLAAAGPPGSQGQQILLPPLASQHDHSRLVTPPRYHEFTLRHIYHKGSHRYPDLLRVADVHPDSITSSSSLDHGKKSLRVAARPITVQRMVDRDAQRINNILDIGRSGGDAVSLPASAWSLDELPAPDVTDMTSITSFAYMAANAYITEPWTGAWKDIKGTFNYTEDFGWENDGLRGHIFADTTNSTIVIGLKGTSPAVFDGADTTGNDKLNDNLFGSCCCGQGGQYFWKTVCDCRTSAYQCNNTCLTKSLRERSHYYHAAKDLYLNVTERYPNADVWLTGHSLGGVVTSLLGLTFGLPTLTFEAFPDALAARRLGLPTPPGYRAGHHKSRSDTGIYHFGHTADPVYMGVCNSASSACTIGGYAFQSQCHTGRTCTFDTVGDFGWRVGIGTHKIESVVNDVLPKYSVAPTCQEDVDCVDCFNWSFFESNGSETTTTTTSRTSTRSMTRTVTCETPGWWGCLDQTATVSQITSTSTFTTTTCLVPGWFGCKETSNITQTTTFTTQTSVPVSTTLSTTTTTPHTLTSTTTCSSLGWFGKCLDSTTSVVAKVAAAASLATRTQA